MAAATVFQQFPEDLGKQVHDLDADTIKIALFADAPSASLDAVLADLTGQVANGNGYTTGGTAVANFDYEHTAGLAKFVGDNVVFTAAGGTIGPFRYVVMYNDTPTAPADPLIQFWDYGSDVTLQIGETFTVDPTTANEYLHVDGS